VNLRCANCSGEMALERDDAFIVCPFCNSSLYLDRAHTFKDFLLPPAVSETGARDHLARELSLREVPPAQVLKLEKLLLPYWGVRGESLQETLPAYSPEPPAMDGYRLPSAGAVFYSGGRAPGFEPMRCSEASSTTWERREDVSSFALYRVPFFKISFGPPPLTYTAWVDGVSGKVFLDETPPPMSHEITAKFLKVVFALFGLFTVVAALVPGFGWSLLAVAACAAAAFPLVRRHAGGGGG
jgi:hypothetical protein